MCPASPNQDGKKLEKTSCHILNILYTCSCMWVIDLKHMLSNKEELELYHSNFIFSLFLKQKGQWPKIK